MIRRTRGERKDAPEVRAVDLGRMVVGSAAGVTIAAGASAHADEPCARVLAPDTLAPRWALALAELGRQSAQPPAADCHPMTMSIEPADGTVRVVAITEDGRRAERA